MPECFPCPSYRAESYTFLSLAVAVAVRLGLMRAGLMLSLNVHDQGLIDKCQRNYSAVMKAVVRNCRLWRHFLMKHDYLP